jgi:hypothetical protein
VHAVSPETEAYLSGAGESLPSRNHIGSAQSDIVLTEKNAFPNPIVFIQSRPRYDAVYSKGAGYLRQIPISLPVKDIERQDLEADTTHHGIVFSMTYKGSHPAEIGASP